ncbi:MAG: single-stranded-DNA-specific exonuclease RecJ [Aureispira sp.]
MNTLNEHTIMRKRWELVEYDVNEATTLQQQLGIHPIFCQLLVQRGINTYDKAKHFFRPQLSHLHDPFLMMGMERAVQRIGQALVKKEKILVYGDYDVDGTTAVALLYSFLGRYHDLVEFYIPNRYAEGYGISLKGIDYALEQNCSLMIALDCGIKAHDALRYAQEKALDVIVCDHHLPDTTLPPAYAILNPKQPNCPYPYKELSGCAIGFKLIEAFAQFYNLDFEENVQPFLDLVAVSLASDFVALTGENRVLASFGLKQLNKQPCLGLQALMEALGKTKDYNIRDVVFGIAPHINAAGRLEDALLAVQLLTAPNLATAEHLAEQLIELNEKRRYIEQDIVRQAQQLIQQDIGFAERRALLLYHPDWHQGVLGIVAAKMVDQYHKPCLVLTKANGRLVGSARSSGNFDIHAALEQCEDLLIHFGGHPFAAGLTLKESNWEAFVARFEGLAQQAISAEAALPIQAIDAYLSLPTIKDSFWQLLKQFAPFGPQNMRPVFASQQVVDTGYSKLLNQKHLKLILQQNHSTPVEGIAFRQGHHFEALKAKKPFELCYVLEENYFKGRTKLQLNVKELHFRS